MSAVTQCPMQCHNHFYRCFSLHRVCAKRRGKGVRLLCRYRFSNYGMCVDVSCPGVDIPFACSGLGTQETLPPQFQSMLKACL